MSNKNYFFFNGYNCLLKKQIFGLSKSKKQMKKYNFYAGPAILPQEVLHQAGIAAKEYSNIGMSLLEISHRSKEVSSIMEEAESLVFELLNINREDYGVLFLGGGASSQFFMSAMNLLDDNESAGYIDTGSWSSKAIKEAQHFGDVNILASSKNNNYNYIPKGYHIPDNLKYLHLTSNNTIFGTQYKDWPDTDVPLVCDMSSDIFSRGIPLERFDIIYAGAQKNLGPSGVTLVIVKNSALGKVNRHIPTMLDYKIHVSKKSTFNTPPVFPIYVSLLTLRWLKNNGGISQMQIKNETKAQVLYDEIDRNPLFSGTAELGDRSNMNVCFLADDSNHEEAFLNKCQEAGCVGMKGHRSVGGFRASIYNAMQMEGIEVLVSIMKDMEISHG